MTLIKNYIVNFFNNFDAPRINYYLKIMWTELGKQIFVMFNTLR